MPIMPYISDDYKNLDEIFKIIKESDLGSVINGVLSFVMVIAALLVLGYLIMGAMEWITSGGDKGKTEAARNKITAAVVGIIILAASFAILNLVLNFIGFGSLSEALKFTTI